jgi:hypothetical protein
VPRARSRNGDCKVGRRSLHRCYGRFSPQHSQLELLTEVGPEPKLIQVGDADRPVVHPVYQVPADPYWKITPSIDSWHQLPKTIRPI